MAGAWQGLAGAAATAARVAPGQVMTIVVISSRLISCHLISSLAIYSHLTASRRGSAQGRAE